MAASAGANHSAAVGEDGALFVWGSGKYGQLGTGDIAGRLAPTRVAGLSAPVRQVAAGGWHTGIVTEAGDLLMCGARRNGRLGLGDEDNRVKPMLVARAVFDGEAVLMVACGELHMTVVTEGGGVYTDTEIYSARKPVPNKCRMWSSVCVITLRNSPRPPGTRTRRDLTRI